MSSWAPLALIGTTAAFLVLPVVPALYELRKRADAAPLPTSRHDGRIANFAEVFESRMDLLRPRLEECRANNEIRRATLAGQEVLLVGRRDFDFDPALLRGMVAVICSHGAVIPAASVIEADLHAGEMLEIGEGAALRAALGAGHILAGRNSAILRWLHAHGSVHLRAGSTAYGRLSAGQCILLEPGCHFEHMYAPNILTCGNQKPSATSLPFRTDTDASQPHSVPLAVGPASDVFDSSRSRLRIEGDFILPAGETRKANVIASGVVRFGCGSRLFGSAKGYKDVILEEDSQVHGSIVCGRTLRLGPRSFIAGPATSESNVVIAQGSRVGTAEALTTVTSCEVTIAPECELHGTVWARKLGSVEA